LAETIPEIDVLGSLWCCVSPPVMHVANANTCRSGIKAWPDTGSQNLQMRAFPGCVQVNPERCWLAGVHAWPRCDNLNFATYTPRRNKLISSHWVTAEEQLYYLHGDPCGHGRRCRLPGTVRNQPHRTGRQQLPFVPRRTRSSLTIDGPGMHALQGSQLTIESRGKATCVGIHGAANRHR